MIWYYLMLWAQYLILLRNEFSMSNCCSERSSMFWTMFCSWTVSAAVRSLENVVTYKIKKKIARKKLCAINLQNTITDSSKVKTKYLKYNMFTSVKRAWLGPACCVWVWMKSASELCFCSLKYILDHCSLSTLEREVQSSLTTASGVAQFKRINLASSKIHFKGSEFCPLSCSVACRTTEAQVSEW